MPGEEAKVFSIPPEEILTVQIMHPTFDWFDELNLQWFAVPFVTSTACISIN